MSHHHWHGGGIAALPVHDSLIVPRRCEQTAAAILVKNFERRYPKASPCKVTTNAWNVSQMPSLFLLLFFLPPPQGQPWRLNLDHADCRETNPMTSGQHGLKLMAADRMRRHRERRRSGLRCLTIEIREAEVAELIRRGLLKPETRNDHNAIIEALYVHLERSLGSMPWRETYDPD
jgi:hypothetical protein